MIITIDGPSGTGKSTVAKGVAKRLGFTFFDTGAMYRSFAWEVLRQGIDPLDQAQVERAIEHFQFEIRTTLSHERRYFVEGKDVTHEIRSSAVSTAASQVAVYPKVRSALVQVQRKFGHAVDAVFEGRDMGTVVFPDADLKIFLSADSEVRAERRYRELIYKFPDLSLSKEEILQEIRQRDETDSTRAISPLKQAKDAILIDTSHLNAQQVIDKIVRLKPKRKFPKMKFSYRAVYLLAKLFFKLFFRLKIYGLEHFKDGSAVIASNHTSFYDPPVLSISCPEEVHFLAKESLFKVPIFGRLIRTLNSHPVTRGASDVAIFRKVLDLLSQGKKVILFPEGRRSNDGELLPLERGLSFLVQKAKCAVIPAYIQGAFEAWPQQRRFPKLFGKMRVVFGSAIEWEERDSKKEVEERILQETEKSIRALKEWLESGAKGTPP